MNKSFSAELNARTTDLLLSQFQPEDEVLKKVRENHLEYGLPEIYVGQMDARHLEVFTRMCGAKKIVEIGTLGGYSGVCLARALPEDGKLYTFDLQEKHVQAAEKAFQLAGVQNKVKQFQGAALRILPEIEKEGPFDLVFVDADKHNYINYGKWAEKHLRPGGVLLADNTLGFGLLTATEFTDKDEKEMVDGIREYNAWISKNRSFKSTFLPTGEGMILSVKQA